MLPATKTAVVAACIGAAACGPGVIAFDSRTGPDGSAAHVWEIRTALARGDDKAAQRRVASKDAGAGDALLRELERGVVAYYAGDYDAATTSFERVYWLDDARETRSLASGVAALVTNDIALPYRPGDTERAMLHYFGAMAWTAKGRPDEAAVEARRLSAHLAHLADAKRPLASDLTATLHDVAAAVYSAAGDRNDADVALRLRDRTQNADTLNATDAGAPACRDCGELVLMVERGFVTHRVGRSLGVAIADGDMAVVGRLDDDPSGLGAAMLALDRASAPRYCGWSARAICGYDRRASYGGDVTLVNVAWPELRAPRRSAGPLQITIGDSAIIVDDIGGDISSSVADDFGRDAPARLARAAGRVIARQLMVEAGEKALDKADDSKKHKTAWRVAGLVAFVAAGASAIAERADTRSWALVPDHLVVKRMWLPAGEYTVWRDAAGRRTSTVVVKPGATTIATVRDWGMTAPVVVAAR
jgi:hypothetical protein